MKIAIALLVAAVVTAPSMARADCAMQIQDLKEKVARIPDKAKRVAANKELNKTVEIGRGSETECLNGLTRTRRLMNAPDGTAVKKDENAPANKKAENPQVNWK